MAILPPANGEVAKVISGGRHSLILDQNREQQPRRRERMPQADPPNTPVPVAADDSEVAPRIDQTTLNPALLEGLRCDVNGIALGDPPQIDAHPGVL